jgi:2-polyprenyl-3-methyl-5-hydroxy-6-metoxy-1,4-benzoquinol methylase
MSSDVIDAYRGTTLGARIHIRLRDLMVPHGRIERLVPADASVLEIGSGHGLLAIRLAAGSPARTVHGTDVDAGRIAAARTAARRLGLADRATFEHTAPGWAPARDAYDAVVIADVLYLLGSSEAQQMMAMACAALRPGGTVVVKEVAHEPRWKHRAAVYQEILSVRALRITQGSQVSRRPLEPAATAFATLGWAATEVPLDHGYPYSHCALVAIRPR